MTTLSQTSVEIIWLYEGENKGGNGDNGNKPISSPQDPSTPLLSPLTPSQGQPQRIRQIVRALCPVPVIVVPFDKSPAEFGILVLPPWDLQYRKCLEDSTLMSRAQKDKAIEDLELGLKSK